MPCRYARLCCMKAGAIFRSMCGRISATPGRHYPLRRTFAILAQSTPSNHSCVMTSLPPRREPNLCWGSVQSSCLRGGIEVARIICVPRRSTRMMNELSALFMTYLRGFHATRAGRDVTCRLYIARTYIHRPELVPGAGHRAHTCE